MKIFMRNLIASLLKHIDVFFLIKKKWIFLKKRAKNNYIGIKKGVNLLGYLDVGNGIGQSARGIRDAINEENIEYSLINFSFAIRKNLKTEINNKSDNTFKFQKNIIHVNPPGLPYVWMTYKKSDLINKYTIGYWYWELPVLPKDWLFAFDYVDEIWVASQYVFDIMKKYTEKPISIIPPSISIIFEEKYERSDFNLPNDSFLFLCVFDFLSFSERKNPWASINAFLNSFSNSNDSVGLVIKINNGNTNSVELNFLYDLIENYSNIYVINETYNKNKMNNLINSIDVFISLHRAEGFGLVIAEAMFLGKPVIATYWSGNVDFMTIENACCVSYSLKKVEKYNMKKNWSEDQVWAEPNIDDACKYMKKLFFDKIFYSYISNNAKETIKSQYSVEVIGKKISNRIDYIDYNIIDNNKF